MPRFFITNQQIDGNTIVLNGADAHHIARSLRMAVGDILTLCDVDSIEYTCRITEFRDDTEVFTEILSSKNADTEPPMQITLFQALCKGDKLDTVIQKAVECGVSRIVPFESERCVVRAKSDSEDKKTERRMRIATEAAKQCGRGVLPIVERTVDFKTALQMVTNFGLVLFCYEGEGTKPLGRILSEFLVPNAVGKYPDVAVFVGSEGGFSKEEAELARDLGCVLTGLGKRILRTETAPIFAVSCVVCAAELT